MLSAVLSDGLETLSERLRFLANALSVQPMPLWPAIVIIVILGLPPDGFSRQDK